MRKSLRTFLNRSIVVLLLLTFLTFTVGKVKKVEAVATTAAIVGEVLLGLGVTYIAYQTLTGANVYIPGYEDTSDFNDYIRGLGHTFSQTRSGSNLFTDLYNKLITDSTYSVMDFTQDRLRDIYNDHKSIAEMQEDSSFEVSLDTDLIPINGYTYSFQFVNIPHIFNGRTFDYYRSLGRTIEPFTGVQVIYYSPTTNTGTILNTYYDDTYEYRNMFDGEKYYTERSEDGVHWTNFHVDKNIGFDYVDGDTHLYLYPNYNMESYRSNRYNSTIVDIPASTTYPIFPNERIYDSTQDEYLPLVPVDSNGNQLTPQYPQNNDDDYKLPIIPYVELPSTQKWGFNWRDALTDLINGGSRMITYSWLADLINGFKNSLSGTGDDINYNYFNEGDTYYITYYSDTVNDIDNPIYNINISDEEDVIPVDLNTISQYTDNQFLSALKERATAAGNTFAEYVAFWHNCDPEIVYVLLGSGILILLGAFIGKWGHS